MPLVQWAAERALAAAMQCRVAIKLAAWALHRFWHRCEMRSRQPPLGFVQRLWLTFAREHQS